MANGDGLRRNDRQHRQRRQPQGRDATGLRRQPQRSETAQQVRANQGGAGNLSRAFDVGMAQVRAMGPATAATVTGSLGFEDTARGFAEQTEDIQREAAQDAQGLTRFRDLRDPETGEIQYGDIPAWAAETVAMEVPSLAAQVAGGAVGGGAVRGARRGLRALRGRGRGRTPSTRGEAPAGRAPERDPAQRPDFDDLARNRRAEAAGAVGGGAATGGAIATGEILPRLTTDPNADDYSMQDLSQRALAGGAASGALQAIPIAGVARRLGLGREAAERITQRSLGARLARGTAGQAAREVPVDVAQAAISRGVQGTINDNIGLFDDEGLMEMLEAGASSGLIGGATGALTSLPGRPPLAGRDPGTARGTDAEVAAAMGPDNESSIDARMEGDIEGTSDTAQRLQGMESDERPPRRRRGTGRIAQRMERNREQRTRQDQRAAESRRRLERLRQEAPELASMFEGTEDLGSRRTHRRLAEAELDLARERDPRPRADFSQDLSERADRLSQHLQLQRQQAARTLEEVQSRLPQDRGEIEPETDDAIRQLEADVRGLDEAIGKIERGQEEEDANLILDSVIDSMLNEEAELTPNLARDLGEILRPYRTQVTDMMRLRMEERGQDPADPVMVPTLSGVSGSPGRATSQQTDEIESMLGRQADETQGDEDPSELGDPSRFEEISQVDAFEESINLVENEARPEYVRRPPSARDRRSPIQTNLQFYNSPEAQRQVHGDRFDQSDRGPAPEIQRLRNRYPDQEFETVPLSEAVEAEARDQGINEPSELRAYMNTRAQEIAEARRNPNRRTIADLYDDDNPAAFLDNFQAIRRRRLPSQLSRGDDEVMQPGEVDALMQPIERQDLRRQAADFIDGRREQMPTMEDQDRSPRGVIPVRRYEEVRRTEQGPIEERPAAIRAVNVMDVAKAMADRRPMQGDFGPDRVAELVMGGLNAMSSSMHVRAEVPWSKLPDDLVVFTTAEGREYTWGEVKGRGAAQLRRRINQLERRRERTRGRAKERLDEELERLQGDYYRSRRREGVEDQREGWHDRDVVAHPERFSDREVVNARQRIWERVERAAIQRDLTFERGVSDDSPTPTRAQLLTNQEIYSEQNLQTWSLPRLQALRQTIAEILEYYSDDGLRTKLSEVEGIISEVEQQPDRPVTDRDIRMRGDRARDEASIRATAAADSFDQRAATGERQAPRMGSREAEGARGWESLNEAAVMAERREHEDDNLGPMDNPTHILAKRVSNTRRLMKVLRKAKTQKFAAEVFEQRMGYPPSVRGIDEIRGVVRRQHDRLLASLQRRSLEERRDSLRRNLSYASTAEARSAYKMLFGETLPEDVTLTQIDQLNRGELRVDETGALVETQPEPLTEAQAADRRQRLQGIAGEWARNLGIEAEVLVVSRDDLDGLVTDNVMAQVDSGAIQAFATPVNADGQIQVYVNEALSDTAAVETLGHEIGHVIYRERVRDLSEADSRKLMDAFHKWRRAQDKDDRPMPEVLRSKQALQRMVDALEGSHKGDAMGDLTTDEREYILAFDEWFADNVSRWLTQTKEPQGAVNRFFSRVADRIKQLVAFMRGRGVRFRADRAVAGFMRDLWHGRGREHYADTASREAVERNRQPLPQEVQDAIPGLARKHGISEDGIRVTEDFVEAATDDPYSDDTTSRIKYAIDNLLSTEEKAVLGRAFSAPHVRRQLRSLINDPAVMASIDNGNARLAVAHGYQLWLDNAINLGRQSDSLFRKIRAYAEEQFGLLSDETRARNVLQAMHQGRVEARRTGTIVDRSIAQRFRQANRYEKTAANAVQVAEAAMYPLRLVRPAATRVVNSGIPQLEALVDAFYPRVQSEGRGRSMMEGRQQNMARFFNGFDDATSGLTQEQGQQVLELLQNPERTSDDAQVTEAARKVRKQLREMRDYAIDSGVVLGDQGDDYFPQVWDTDTVLENRQALVNLLAQEKFDSYLGVVPGDGDVQQQRINRANEIVDAIVQHDGYGDAPQTPSDGGHTPFMASAHERRLSWINEAGDAQDREQLAQFMMKDLGRTLAVYTEQIVKRSEYARQFGVDGNRLEAMLEQARQFGATDEQLKDARNFVSAMMGTMGRELHPALRNIIESIGRVFGQDWSDVQPERFRGIQGAIIVYQNIRVLGLATLTSLADTAGIIARADSADVALEGFRSGLREIANSLRMRAARLQDEDPTVYDSELRKLARSLGTIDTHLVNEVLDEAFSGQYLTGNARRANEFFFRAIQLQRWTRFSRMMGLASGRSYLKRLYEGEGAYDRHGERFREQLGLREGDITLDDQGELRVYDSAEREAMAARAARLSRNEATQEQAAEIRADLSRDARIRTALNRYVDQAVMRPNASQRPLIGSHPDAQLLMHLKQFAYTIQTQIVNRVLSEAGHGNYYPLAAVFSYVPIMIASDLLREMIQYGPEGDPRKRTWGFWDYTTDAVHRSGMTGVGNFLLDVRKDRTQFGGIGYESMVGPTGSQAMQLGDLLTNNDADGTDAFIDAMPANNVYKYWGIDEILGASWNQQANSVSGWRG